jgi:hypothetical protein
MEKKEIKIPTNQGKKTVDEIVNTLMYQSYEANRGYGVAHEALINIGVGSENFMAVYESRNKK